LYVVKSGILLASRFRVIRTLGKGGMSKVFEAIDTHYDRRVALKAIRRAEGLSLLRFKEEFRSLAELRHPNLVELYDLARDGKRWFFSMELIEGIDLITHIEAVGGSGSMYGLSTDDSQLEDGDLSEHSATPWHEVRRMYAEIGRALVYLHERGTIHRDLKPSNILVDAMGRPRILDFGIAKFVGVAEEVQTALSRRKVGTPGYVAPEQIKGKAIPASDIYSLGVILYRILTGRLPFRGRKRDVLVAHLTEMPPPPGDVPGVDSELAELAMRMLDKDPARRPIAAELEQLAALDAPRQSIDMPSLDDTDVQTPFVGREGPVREALGHLLEMTIGGPLMVCIDGPSGIGKTRLAEEVIDLARQRGVRCFYSRCYEREQIPYKAFDSTVDQLVGTLVSSEDRELLLNAVDLDKLRILSRMFPYAAELMRQRKDETSQERPVLREPAVRRHQAFTALQRLLDIVAGGSGLLLFIDDLQWADGGSFELLDHLLRQRGQRLGIMATLRPDEGVVPAWITENRPSASRRIYHIPLSSMEANETETLVHSISPGMSLTDETVESIVEEAEGNPLIIEELVRFNRDNVLESGRSTSPISFNEMVRRRHRSLEPGAQDIVEICAAAAYALELGAIAAAAKLSIQETSSLAVMLTDQRILRRVAGKEGRVQLVPFHDRATRIVLEEVEPARRRQIHRRLAASLEQSSPESFHALADHWRMAGVPERASTYALRAAEHAEQVQLLDRAIRYYAMALGFPPAGVEEWQIRIRLAEALDRRGRFTEAGRAFRAAASRSPIEVRSSLMLRGARAMLKSGDAPLAVRTMSNVTELIWAEPLVLPWGRLLLGTAHEVLGSRPWIPPGLVFRGSGDEIGGEICLDVAQVLRFLLPQRSLHLMFRGLRLARHRGDPVMTARALVALAGFVGTIGSPWLLRRAQRLLGKAEALFGADRAKRGLADLHGARAFLCSMDCRWDDMRASTAQALEVFRDEGVERSWEAQMVQVQAVLGEVDAGDLTQADLLCAELLPERKSWSDPDLLLWIRWARIRIEMAFGRWEVVEKLCRVGLRSTTETPAASRPLWSRFRGALAVAQAGQGNDSAAVTGLERTQLALRRQYGLDPLSLSEFRNCAVFVYASAAGREVGSQRKRYLRRTRRIARRLSRSTHRVFHARGLRWLAEADLIDGRAERAARTARRAVDGLLASRQRLEAAQALLTQARAEAEAKHPAAEETRRVAARQVGEILKGAGGSKEP